MAVPTLNDWNSALGGYTAPQAPAGPSGVTVADWDSILNGPEETAETLQPSALKRLAAGMGRGAVDVQQTISKLGLEGLTHLGYPQIASDYYNNKINRERKLYESTHPDALMGTGRVVGQGLTELPLFMVGGEAATPLISATGIPAAAASAGGAPTFALRTAGRAITGGLLGGTAAGLTSSGYDKPFWQQVKQGAEVGAIINPLVPLVEAPIKYGARAIKNVANPVLDSRIPGLMRRSVVNGVRNRLLSDSVNPDDIAEVMAGMGPESTLVDAASKGMGIRQGANTRNLAELVANSPGEGSAIANKVLQERMDNMPDAINQDVMNLTGQKGDVYKTLEEQMAKRSKEAKPLYDKAFAADITPDDRLNEFLSDPIVQRGLKRGQEIARLDALAKGEPFIPEDYAAPEAGNVSMRALDAAKNGLDDILEGYRDKTTGRLNLDKKGHALNNVRAELVNHLDELNPDYAAARAAWAGPSQSIDKVHEGMDIFKKRVTPESIEHSVSKMSPSDHEFYLTGVTRALQDALESGPDGANAVRRVFRTPAQRAKIKAAIGDEAKYEEFKKQMENKAIMAETRNQVLSNSSTVRRQNAPAALSDIMEPIGHLANANPLGAIGSAARSVNNYLMMPSEDRLAAYGQLLFNQDPQAVAAELSRYQPKGYMKAFRNALSSDKIPLITLGYQSNQGR